jgi:hypothetical protein
MQIVASTASAQALEVAGGGSLARVIDRWVFVFMAVWFIAIVLTGFIPDSLMKIGQVQAGQRPPFPPMLHAHAVLMGSFLLLLLAQATLMATGRRAHHRTLGLAGMVLAPAMVVVGVLLIPIVRRDFWEVMQAAPPSLQAGLQQTSLVLDNIMLLQIQVGVLFSVFITLALLARTMDPGLHKRLMFLTVALPLPAAFDRITWLPTTLPASPVSPLLYVLLAVLPLFVWDLVRTRTVHKAYLIWLAGFVPASILVYALWDTSWWHAIAPRMVGLPQ